MTELLYPITAIIIGFVGLIWSADRFVEGSASIAKAAGLSTLVIGLTIVSFGTSAPEILVSVNAALSGAGELAIGNALGSNLANVGLVLGITAIVATLPIQKHLLQHEMPLLIGANLTRIEGLILLATLVPLLTYLVIIKKKTLTKGETEAEEDFPTLSGKMAAFWFVVGLALLVVSSKALVWGATQTATHFGVSPLIIGLTVVAVGTSLPELATGLLLVFIISIVSSKRGDKGGIGKGAGITLLAAYAAYYYYLFST